MGVHVGAGLGVKRSSGECPEVALALDEPIGTAVVRAARARRAARRMLGSLGRLVQGDWVDGVDGWWWVRVYGGEGWGVAAYNSWRCD